MEDIVFSKDELRDFIINWDSIEKKYPSIIKKDISLRREIESKFYLDFDKTVSKKKIHKAFKTVEHIYFSEDANKYRDIIENVFNKFIYQFVNIEGIDDLFDSTYFDMEWQMHFGYDFDRNVSNYYRDHYIHQIRNMFELFSIVEKLDYDKYINDWIINSNTNFVSEYIKNLLKYDCLNMPIAKLELYQKLLLDEPQDFEYINCSKNSLNEDELRVKEMVMEKFNVALYSQLSHELVYSCIIISSLIHDIGYPLAFAMNLDKKILHFLPNSLKFLKVINDIDYLESKLKDTLLFRLIDISEIKEQLDKYDHGLFSALILLLYYHENGKIYSFTKTELATIELSALIIYNHTLKYKELDKKGTGDPQYIRNIFSKNPISYLFRLCDDIQEWDRIYFELTESGNYLFCFDCGMPIINENDSKRNTVDRMDYICGCSKGEQKKCCNARQNTYRKTINVKCCEKVEIYEESRKHSVLSSPRKILNLKVYYDLFNQLEILKYNPQFAKYRSQELIKVKKMLSEQNDLDTWFVDYFVSNNPVEIKLEILFEYVNINYFIETIPDNLPNIVLEEIGVKEKNENYEYFSKKLEYYFNILKEREVNFSIYGNDKNKFLREMKKINKRINNRQFNDLLDYSLRRYYDLSTLKNKMDEIKEGKKQKTIDFNKLYYNTFIFSDYEIENCTLEYIKLNQYKEFLEERKNDKNYDNMDFYSDLYIFYLISQKLKRHKI